MAADCPVGQNNEFPRGMLVNQLIGDDCHQVRGPSKEFSLAIRHRLRMQFLFWLIYFLTLRTVGQGGIVVTALTLSDPLAPLEVAVGSFANPSGPISVKVLTHFNTPLTKQLEISAPEAHWIDSADGTKVHVWVIKPIGFKAGRKYPAVLEIHGGPHAQYGETFFHEFQVLAAAGYVVVYSNPRGSKGYGDAHFAADRGGDRLHLRAASSPG